MITVRTIGAAEVVIGKRRITPRTEVMFAVAVYLAMRAGERLTRAHLAELIWPACEATRARHSLRQMLYRLRRLGFPLVDEGEQLTVDSSEVDCDAHHLLSPRSSGFDPIESPPSSTEFLPNAPDIRSLEYAEWVDRTRSQVSAQIRRAALRRLEHARKEGRWPDVSRWADVVLTTDPLNEEATLAKAESFALVGSKARAVSLLDNFLSELGENSIRLGLPATILRRRISEQQLAWGMRLSRELPLVGRGPQLARLTDALNQAAQGRGCAIQLIGPAGVGKSRLAAELKEIAELRGFRCVHVRAEPSDSVRPFSFAVTIASRLAELPGAAGASPEALGIVQRLTLPGARTSSPAVVGSEITGSQIGWALAELAAAVASEHKLLIVCDDVHHVDAESEQPMTQLFISSTSHRLATVVTRRAPADPHLVGPAESTYMIRMNIPPLSQESATQLAQSFSAALATPLSDAALASIIRAAAGNPLFLRELTAFHDFRQPSTKVPQSLIELIEARIGQLSPHHIRILRLISLLGSHATISRLRTLAPSATPDLPAILEDLESEGMLVLATDGVLELHECWSSAVTDGVGHAARGALALDCAVLLDGECARSDDANLAWRAAQLFSCAGAADSAVRCYTSAGDTLLLRGLARQASEAFARAMEECGEGLCRAVLLERSSRAQLLGGQYPEAIQSARSGLAMTAAPGPASAALRAQLLGTLGDALWREGLPYAQVLQQLAELVVNPEVPDRVRQQACLSGMRLVYIDSDSALGEHLFRVVAEANVRSGPSLPGELARLIFAAERGPVDLVRDLVSALGSISAEEEPALLRHKALRYRASALRFVGDIAAACALAEGAHADALANGWIEEANNCAHFLLFLHLDADDLERAAFWLERAQSRTSLLSSHHNEAQDRHAVGRYMSQSGQYGSCLEHYSPSMDAVRRDSVLRRQTADATCIALAAAAEGRTDLAREMLTIALRVIRNDTPTAQLDFSVDTAIRALRMLASPAEAEDVGMAYLRRRRDSYDRPLAPACHVLRSLMQADGQSPQ